MGRRNKVVACELFSTVWELSSKFESESETFRALASPTSEYRTDFKKKYDLDESEAAELVSYCFRMRKKSFAEVLKEAGKKKAAASRELCVPIRTLEDWCNGKGHCPEYVKLLVMKKWKLFKIPKGFVMEDDAKPQRSAASTKPARKRDELPLYTKEEAQAFQHSVRKTYAEMIRDMEEHRKALEEKRKRNDWWAGE